MKFLGGPPGFGFLPGALDTSVALKTETVRTDFPQLQTDLLVQKFDIPAIKAPVPLVRIETLTPPSVIPSIKPVTVKTVTVKTSVLDAADAAAIDLLKLARAAVVKDKAMARTFTSVPLMKDKAISAMRNLDKAILPLAKASGQDVKEGNYYVARVEVMEALAWITRAHKDGLVFQAAKNATDAAYTAVVALVNRKGTGDISVLEKRKTGSGKSLAAFAADETLTPDTRTWPQRDREKAAQKAADEATTVEDATIDVGVEKEQKSKVLIYGGIAAGIGLLAKVFLFA